MSDIEKGPGRPKLAPEKRKVGVGLSLSPSSANALQAIADRNGVSRSRLVEYLIGEIRRSEQLKPWVGILLVIQAKEAWRKMPRSFARDWLNAKQKELRAQIGVSSGIIFTRQWGLDAVMQVWSFQDVGEIEALRASVEDTDARVFFDVSFYGGITPIQNDDERVLEPLLSLAEEIPVQ